MKSEPQLLESIDRFAVGFWAKDPIDHPPVTIVPEDLFLPIKFLKKEFRHPEISPLQVSRDLYLNEYEYACRCRTVQRDDFIPYAAPWRAIPWLEAMCGCPVRVSRGSLAPAHLISDKDQLLNIPIPRDLRWLDCMEQELQKLQEQLPEDCWISPTIIRGPSDVLAALRDLTGFFYDTVDDIKLVDQTAGRINQVIMDLLDRHFGTVTAKLGGFGHILGYWAPGRTMVIQEDALGMCSPQIYADVFMKYNADIVRHLGDYVLFHLHSTGYQHYRHVLEIPGLAGLQMTIETNGPELFDLQDVFLQVLEDKNQRLILYVDGHFEQLSQVLQKLPKEGLYLLIAARYIPTDDDFREFIANTWN